MRMEPGGVSSTMRGGIELKLIVVFVQRHKQCTILMYT